MSASDEKPTWRGRRDPSLRFACVQVFNLNSPQTVYKELDSPLKFQTRCVTCFPDATGYLVSSTTPFSSVHSL